jgi:hypothetical protein
VLWTARRLQCSEWRTIRVHASCTNMHRPVPTMLYSAADCSCRTVLFACRPSKHGRRLGAVLYGGACWEPASNVQRLLQGPSLRACLQREAVPATADACLGSTAAPILARAVGQQHHSAPTLNARAFQSMWCDLPSWPSLFSMDMWDAHALQKLGSSLRCRGEAVVMETWCGKGPP